MAELNIHLDIRVTPRVFRSALAILLMSGLAQELASESVSLTTYYPAPSGVYTQLITTANTYLARDAQTDSGKVGIGTTNMTSILTVVNGDNTTNDIIQAFRLDLTQGVGIEYDAIHEIGSNGNNAMSIDAQGTGLLNLETVGTGNIAMATISGNLVGIGTSAPGAKLEVYGDTTHTGTIRSVNQGGAGLGTVPLELQSDSTFMDVKNGAGTYTMAINNDTGGSVTPVLDFYGSDGSGWFNYMSISEDGGRVVGINNGSPRTQLDVGGNDGVITSHAIHGTSFTYFTASPGIQTCPAGYFATLTSGVDVNYVSIVNNSDPNGVMICECCTSACSAAAQCPNMP